MCCRAGHEILIHDGATADYHMRCREDHEILIHDGLRRRELIFRDLPDNTRVNQNINYIAFQWFTIGFFSKHTKKCNFYEIKGF